MAFDWSENSRLLSTQQPSSLCLLLLEIGGFPPSGRSRVDITSRGDQSSLRYKDMS